MSVGIDIVDVPRFAAMIARRPKMVERLFTDGERRDANGQPERLAARFAAKEAVLKTFGVGLGAASWHAIEVVKAPSGEPSIVLHDAATELGTAKGITALAVSLTHTDMSAAAFVLGWGEGADAS